jgi:hypothetical protein
MKNNIVRLLILIFLLIPIFSDYSFAMSENEKIQYLLHEIEVSGFTFIRNGSEYSSKKARIHLENKLKRAGRHVKTAEDFISKIAARSSFSGRPYSIRMKNGMLVKSEKWLKAKLRELKKSLKTR